jgi:zona occludens toxin
MLIFHEGLPRSGKSYEAVVEHLLPALRKGRKVYARIDGLNFEKLAELSGITLERCQDLLSELTRDQVKAIDKQEFPIGSLILIDEAQNFWPRQRKPLSPEMIEFVSEHGHKGWDILLMGQSFKDVHTLWTNRTSQIVKFRKLEMVGKPKQYVWILLKAIEANKFEQVSKGTKTYEEKYFGTYKSFEEGAEGNQLYDDKRANVFSHPVFRKWIPLFGLLFCVGCYFIWNAFYGNGIIDKDKLKKKTSGAAATSASIKPASAPAKPAEKAPEPKQPDFVRDLTEKYRFRVTAIIKSAKRQHAIFEWYDDALRVRERVTMLTLARMGYSVVLDDDMQYATVTKGKDVYIATQFPSEVDGRVSDATLRDISKQSGSDRDIYLIDGRNAGVAAPAAHDVVASADGYGVLGRAGPGVRQPGIESKPASR